MRYSRESHHLGRYAKQFIEKQEVRSWPFLVHRVDQYVHIIVSRHLVRERMVTRLRFASCRYSYLSRFWLVALEKNLNSQHPPPFRLRRRRLASNRQLLRRQYNRLSRR